MRKRQASIYYTPELKKALDIIYSKDKSGKTFNQAVIDILMRDKEVKETLDNIETEDK